MFNLDYDKVYTRLVKEERAELPVKKIGWQTNTKTKTLMLDEFVAAYRDKALKINDVDLLREMIGLTVEADGSVCLNGKDRIVAGCIAVQAIKQAYSHDMVPEYPNDATYSDKKFQFDTLEEKMRHLAREDYDESLG